MEYTIQKAIEQIRENVSKIFDIKSTDIEVILPAHGIDADLCVPLFNIASKTKKNIQDLTILLINNLNLDKTLLSSCVVEKGFANFKFNLSKYADDVISSTQKMQEDYGKTNLGKNKTVVIDYSSPNIAKPFSVGHLRSTVIGQALYNIYSFLGYKVIGDNHLGDWGTQFGKLIYAYKRWGNKEQIDKDPIKELLKLYIKVHDEAKKDPKIDDEAREWFKKLETGDKEATEIWKWFSAVSLKEFNKIYDLLGIHFDEMLGESFYNDKLKSIVKEAEQKGLLTWEEPKKEDKVTGEEVEPNQTNLKMGLIRLDKFGIATPLVLCKSNGTSLYATRDLAAAEYRIKTWNPELIIYVVGGEQQLYFRQWFEALRQMGHNNKCVHVWFGMMRVPGQGKMSTRAGNAVYLQDVLDEAIEKAKAIIKDRDLTDAEKNEIAKIVAIGAVKYADLSQSRTKDIIYNLDKMLNMQGNSSSYLQYSYVRIKSILDKNHFQDDKNQIQGSLLTETTEAELIKKIAYFPQAVLDSAKDFYPHILCNYLFDLAQIFNKFYQEVSIINTKDKNLKTSRLYLCQITAQILKQGLGLLGIDCPEKM